MISHKAECGERRDTMAELYTCAEVAKRYGVEVITVWDWIRKRKLGAIKLGKEYRISEEDLKHFEDSRRVLPNTHRSI